MTHPPKVPPAPLRRSFLRTLSIVIATLILIIIGLGITGLWLANTPSALSEPKRVIIARGANLRGIAEALHYEGVIDRELPFLLAARVYGHGNLKSGEYEFPAHISASEAVMLLHSGKTVARWFTIAEGLTVDDIIQQLNNDPAMTGIITSLPDEGSLMPDTYRYNYGDSRSAMIARMEKHMRDMLDSEWATRDTAIPLQSKTEAVALAAVVEKETGKAAERPRIAGVFYNRLRLRMRLQSDPTVIYALVKANGAPLGRELKHEDLAFPSPINTYASDGIPPQAICNPGRAAIKAVLHPEQNDFLYFVADGTGGHNFARTLDEHNKNVTAYRKMHQ